MTTEYREDLFVNYESPEYYELLQVQPGATKQTIDAAYRRLAWQYHPDHNPAAGANNRMQQINAAYSTLKDSRRRSAYDREMFYDTEEYATDEAEYDYSPENYSSNNRRRSGISFRTKVEWLAIIITLLIVGGALILKAPATSTEDETPVTGVSSKNVVSNYAAPVLRTLSYSDFDSAQADGWKLGNTWHLTTRQAYSGKSSLWIGDESKGTYRPNLDATADLLKTVDLTGVSYPVLNFQINGQTGLNAGDNRLLVEVAAAGQAFLPVYETHKTYTQWEEVSIDLAQFKGAEINVRFHFISGTGKNITANSGYFLDDVRVENAIPGR